jgi:hypothetical protein
MNEHSEWLGLTAKFNVAVFSLTLKNTWNDLPQSRDDTLEMWLVGEESQATACFLASPLEIHRFKSSPYIEVILVCWETSKSDGADICSNVGQFRCIDFFKTKRVVMHDGTSKLGSSH